MDQHIATALHSGWNAYLVVEWCMMFAFTMNYVDYKFVYFHNVAESMLLVDHRDLFVAIGEVLVFIASAFTISNFGTILMATEHVRKQRSLKIKPCQNGKITDGADPLKTQQHEHESGSAAIKQAEQAILPEEASYQRYLLKLEAFRHLLFAGVLFCFGDAMLTGVHPTNVSSNVFSFCCAYASIHVVMLSCVWLVSCTPQGVESVVASREAVR